MSANPQNRVRLYFGLPNERLDEFAEVYQDQLVPILKKHGLSDSVEQPPPVAAGIFSRIFTLEEASAIAGIDQNLRDDSKWQQMLPFNKLGIDGDQLCFQSAQRVRATADDGGRKGLSQL